MNRPDSFEQACEMRGYNPVTILPDTSGQPEWLANYTTSCVKRVIIAEAINGGKTPQPGQYAWFPVFNKSSFGFSRSCTSYGISSSYVGLRLEFFSKEDSDYFGRNFSEIHRDFITVNN